jgi:hypothetical protein
VTIPGPRFRSDISAEIKRWTEAQKAKIKMQ